MINTVPYLAEHKHAGSYELVVATPCLELLSEKFQDFKIVVDYDPLEPAEEDIRIHGIWEAKKRARINTLNNAAEVTRNGRGHGPAECYRAAIRKAGLQTEFERAILNWDIQHADPQTLKQLTQNLLFLCLNCCGCNDTPSSLDILEWDQNKWLQPFQTGHTDLSKLSMEANVSIKIRKGLEQQTMSLFRRLFEFSGGKRDPRQHEFGIDYTVSQNTALCARLLDVCFSRPFGRFDPQDMQAALSKSKLFAGVSKPDLPDTLEWSRRMMPPEGFALILAALLCRERLLPYTADDTTQPTGGSYLADFDAILNDQPISNRRAVFERMIFSLLRVLYNLNPSEDIIRLLEEVLNEQAPPLELLDGVTDQYCAGKIRGRDHDRAFEEAREGLLKCVNAMLESDGNADAEWIVIDRETTSVDGPRCVDGREFLCTNT
ncbi:MAG: hypothetical protein Q9213_001780 [Squamulea squamosa]